MSTAVCILAFQPGAAFCRADAPPPPHRLGTLQVFTRPGQEVRIRQRRHHFTFGTTVDADQARHPRAQEILQSCFNTAFIAESLLWHHQAEPFTLDFSRADAVLADCRRLGLDVHGGALLWGCADANGTGLFGSQDFWDHQHAASNARLRDLVRHYLRVKTALYRGRIDRWCLLNKPTPGHSDYYLRRLGKTLPADAFRWAREGNPDAELFCSDYGMLQTDGSDAGAFLRRIRRWMTAGVLVDGIAAAGDFRNRYPDPVKVARALDRLASLDLPVTISTFDYAANGNLDKQARGLRDLFRTAFGHPAVKGITLAGVCDAWPWTRNQGPEIPSGLWDKNFRPKPAGKIYLDLVRRQWWTDETLRANDQGFCSIQAFFGDYDIHLGEDLWRVRITPGKPVATVGFAALDPVLLNSFRREENLGEVLTLLLEKTASPEPRLARQARILRDEIQALHQDWAGRARRCETTDPPEAVQLWLRIATAFGKHPLGRAARNRLVALDADETFRKRYAAEIALDKLLAPLRRNHGLRPVDPTRGRKDPLAALVNQARDLRKSWPETRPAGVAESVLFFLLPPPPEKAPPALQPGKASPEVLDDAWREVWNKPVPPPSP